MSLLIEKFKYKKIAQITDSNTGKRVYDTFDGNKLPSVTTILDKTSDKTALYEWRKRVGNDAANKITKLASGVGTLIHKNLENYIQDLPMIEGNSHARTTARELADIIIEKSFSNISEVWGLESPLYYPGLYAGTADVLGLWKGKEAVLDFKNTRKPKKEEWIVDYKLQLSAYAMAHNKLHGTNIETGVILMISREAPYIGEYQEFEINTKDWENEWLKRVATYYGVK